MPSERVFVHSWCATHFAATWLRFFICVPVSWIAATLYIVAGPEFPPISSVTTFPDNVAVPVRNVHDEVTGSVSDALATQTAIWRQTRRIRELFFFCVGHLGDRVGGAVGAESLGRGVQARARWRLSWSPFLSTVTARSNRQPASTVPG